MLIQGADVWGLGSAHADVRIERGKITEIGQLAPRPGEQVMAAKGGLLLPGLHDHHIHLAALAARAASVWCGPPHVRSAAELAMALQHPGTGWLRGIGYHESVMGLPDAKALDALIAHRPLRIQHRGGRMWLLNSLALDHVLSQGSPPPGLERENGHFTGRLFDEDGGLRTVLGGSPPDLAAVSLDLARCGVTGVTDMTPRNDTAMAEHFSSQRHSGALQQNLWLAGTLELANAEQGNWKLGPAKLHLHEAALPDFDQALAFIRSAHAQRRNVAAHCVTEVELVFTLALLEAAEGPPGDRIEHASIAEPAHIVRMANLGLHVCVQPHFIAERGDQYLRDVEPRHHQNLYRLQSLSASGLVLAGGSDAPFASANPWQAMAAAMERTTCEGHVIGHEEALSAEQALALYLTDPADLARKRKIAPGAAADLCLLAQPWAVLRSAPALADVRLTLSGGEIIYQSIDQPPAKRFPGIDPLA